MKNFDRFKSLGQALGIAMGAVAGRQFLSLQPQDKALSWINLLCVAGLIWLLSRVTEEGFGVVLSRSSWLRRLVAGKDFIEGMWLDYTSEEHGIFGIVAISQSQSSLHVHGDGYDFDGNLKYEWTSTLSRFEDRRLEYCYRASLVREGTERHEVIGQLTANFISESPLASPTRFVGSFGDTARGERQVHVEGIRLTTEQARELMTSPKNALRLLVEFGVRRVQG